MYACIYIDIYVYNRPPESNMLYSMEASRFFVVKVLHNLLGVYNLFTIICKCIYTCIYIDIYVYNRPPESKHAI
jgi:hypothetical protein